jgi:hypothetical protein
MSSLQWSKKFEVLSISRLSISSLGFQTEEVKALTDKDMEAIADSIQNGLQTLFSLALTHTAGLYLAEKKAGLHDEGS